MSIWNKLISTIQFDYEQRMTAKGPKGITIPDIHWKDKTDTLRYSLIDLVNAGELQYTEQTMSVVATEIASRFKSDPNRDFNALVSETV